MLSGRGVENEGVLLGRNGNAPESVRSESVRPDLPIPLAPTNRAVELFGRAVIGLRRPSFDRARNATLGWAATTVGVLVAGETIVAAAYRPTVLTVAVLMAAYTIARAVALAVFERRQDSFERRWLDEQSQRLQQHSFEILRFSLPADAEGCPGERENVDLTDPDQVSRLLRRQAAERFAPVGSRVHIEFTYWPGPGENRAVESVRRELNDIDFCPIETPVTRARIRFPEATYGSHPALRDGGQRWPGRGTYWFLAGPIRVTVAGASPLAAARAGYGAPAVRSASRSCSSP